MLTKYSAMFCADNGFDYDGPFNCCTYESGYCYSDEGCCGSLVMGTNFSPGTARNSMPSAAQPMS